MISGCETIYLDYALDIMFYVPLVFMLLPGKSESIYRSMWSAIRSLCERRNLTLEPTTMHIDFEVAMHTVLQNAQCTFKNKL